MLDHLLPKNLWEWVFYIEWMGKTTWHFRNLQWLVTRLVCVQCRSDRLYLMLRLRQLHAQLQEWTAVVTWSHHSTCFTHVLRIASLASFSKVIAFSPVTCFRQKNQQWNDTKIEPGILVFIFVFLPRDAAMLARSWESIVILSVRPSVCHTRTLWLIQRTYRRIFLYHMKG